MIGFYDYSVWLTYMSLLSAVTGIIISMHGTGHPYWGIFFLMFSGFCDAFDGRVARMKKDRTDAQKAFGIQIDSLADLVAFGVLPVCIGEAMLTVGPDISGVSRFTVHGTPMKVLTTIIFAGVFLFYVLAALIRLAYFNVIEEERQKGESGCRKSYIGLPVTSASLIFPTILLFQYILPMDISIVYIFCLFLTGVLFITNFKVTKPGLRGILIMVGIGVVEGILLLIGMFVMKHVS